MDELTYRRAGWELAVWTTSVAILVVVGTVDGDAWYVPVGTTRRRKLLATTSGRSDTSHRVNDVRRAGEHHTGRDLSVPTADWSAADRRVRTIWYGGMALVLVAGFAAEVLAS